MPETPPQKPPGLIPWLVTGVSLAMPIAAIPCGWIGITDHGNTIAIGWFVLSFSLLVVSAVLSFIVHLWGMVRAFYPKISKGWLSICLLGIGSGLLTMVVGLILVLRINGMV
jgi:hypothetical protein